MLKMDNVKYIFIGTFTTNKGFKESSKRNCHNPNDLTTQPQQCSLVGHNNDCAIGCVEKLKMDFSIGLIVIFMVHDIENMSEKFQSRLTTFR